MKLASYQGITSTGVIKEVIGLNEDIAGRTIVIVEDIVDTGLTMQRLLDTLGTRNPEAIHIASLLVKPEKLKVNLNIEYVAMEIPNILSLATDWIMMVSDAIIPIFIHSRLILNRYQFKW